MSRKRKKNLRYATPRLLWEWVQITILHKHTYIHTHTHTHTHKHIYIHIHTHAHTYRHTHIYNFNSVFNWFAPTLFHSYQFFKMEWVASPQPSHGSYTRPIGSPYSLCENSPGRSFELRVLVNTDIWLCEVNAKYVSLNDTSFIIRSWVIGEPTILSFG